MTRTPDEETDDDGDLDDGDLDDDLDDDDAAPDEDDEGLRRGDVATILNCSVSSVRRLESQGALTPRTDARGAHIFDREQVLRVRDARSRHGSSTSAGTATPRPAGKSADGQVAARVFEMFERGDEAVTVVTTMQIAPALVKELHNEWRSVRALRGGSASIADERVSALEVAFEELRSKVNAVAVGLRAAQPPVLACRCGACGPSLRLAACARCGLPAWLPPAGRLS